MSTNVNNFTPWYWGVQVIDVWEDAYKKLENEIDDKDIKEKELIENAMVIIRDKHLKNKDDLVKKEGCYVATAIYGSYNAPEVLVLRNYRDNKLKKSKLGRWFIKVYYKYSPSLVKYLKNKTLVSNLVRTILDKFINNLILDENSSIR